MNNQEAWSEIMKGLSEVSQLDDAVIKAVKNIKLVLLNLQIESAHIEAETKNKNGITPICKHLNRIVDELDNAGKNILKLRISSAEAAKTLNEHFNEKSAS